MADVLYIDYSDFKKVEEKLKTMPAEIAQRVDDVLTAGAYDIATQAKRLAPVDLGGLRASIAPEVSKPLSKHVTVNVFYAAYVEFGTGAYVPQFIASWPPEWQEYAKTFKGEKKIKGMMPRPYLYVSYEENRPKILKAIETVLNTPTTTK